MDIIKRYRSLKTGTLEGWGCTIAAAVGWLLIEPKNPVMQAMSYTAIGLVGMGIGMLIQMRLRNDILSTLESEFVTHRTHIGKNLRPHTRDELIDVLSKCYAHITDGQEIVRGLIGQNEILSEAVKVFGDALMAAADDPHVTKAVKGSYKSIHDKELSMRPNTFA